MKVLKLRIVMFREGKRASDSLAKISYNMEFSCMFDISSTSKLKVMVNEDTKIVGVYW